MPTIPNPKETIRILDRLVDMKLLGEDEFREMHHLGGSIAGFKRYCMKINAFQNNSRNYQLHEALRMRLASYARLSLPN